jgi:hypothetical protein
MKWGILREKSEEKSNVGEERMIRNGERKG